LARWTKPSIQLLLNLTFLAYWTNPSIQLLLYLLSWHAGPTHPFN
jgi:hypothetical protein